MLPDVKYIRKILNNATVNYSTYCLFTKIFKLKHDLMKKFPVVF